MNKSTPISQLPSAAPHPTFVNEQQKQMITNAQNAIQNIGMPQNTQIPTDIANDDDTTIQEVLNQINNSTAPPPQPPPPSHQEQMYIQQQYQQQLQQQLQQGAGFQQPPQQAIDPMILQGLLNQAAPVAAASASSNVEMFFQMFGDDVKVAVLVMTMYILVHFVPLGSFLARYFAVDRIPYHDVLLKALLAALLVIVAKKLILKI